ncbi:hypothetical protein MTR67_039941 [Solanum verrucosum]|uniref:Uncharacterized protein n=1 Tax=Solanum verrucosum TaxID=315347 RepID=A0AAF0UJH4_SOLVR|nr:hypothetical protein MTR67_039941 [Solanum verrucosum]
MMPTLKNITQIVQRVAENPSVLLSQAASKMKSRNNHFFYSFSSSQEFVIANSSPLLPLPLFPPSAINFVEDYHRRNPIVCFLELHFRCR